MEYDDYEKMFMDEYEKMLYPDVEEMAFQSASETPQMLTPAEPSEPGTFEVVGNVAKSLATAVVDSAKESVEFVKEKPITESVPVLLEELSKGLVSGAIGLPGDTEAIGRGIIKMLSTPEGQSKLESFLTGLGEETLLPTTENVESAIEKFTGESPKGTGFVEGTGQIIAPVGVATKAVKGLVKTSAKDKRKATTALGAALQTTSKKNEGK